MEDWNIQERHTQCTQCQAPFVAKVPCHTLLILQLNGYERQDWCENCWNASGGPDNRDRAGWISSWRCLYEPPEPPPVDPLPKEDAESILRKMLERNDPAEAEARYILAVMLERKRLLKHRETRQEQAPMLVYEHVKTGEVWLIADPKLNLRQLETVQKKVATMLAGGSGAGSETPAA